MKHDELNTSDTSLDRIYKRKVFHRLYFDPNKPEQNTKKIFDFLEQATTKAKEQDIKHWHVIPEEGDGAYEDEQMPNQYLVAIGYQLETDAEYTRRLEWRLTSMKNGYNSWMRNQDYYNGNVLVPSPYLTQVAELQMAIDKISPKS